MTPEERFWAKVDTSGECWVWTANKTKPNGYGRFYPTAKGVLAHRYSYELLVGPIPEGLQLDHLCRVKLCVNPDHLEPVTNQENVKRGLRVTRPTCKQGHLTNGGICKLCRATYKLAWERERKKDPTYRERRRALERKRYRIKMADPAWRANKRQNDRISRLKRLGRSMAGDDSRAHLGTTG